MRRSLAVAVVLSVLLGACAEISGLFDTRERFDLISIAGNSLPVVEFVGKSPDSPRPDTTWLLDAQLILRGDSAALLEHSLVQKIAGGTTQVRVGGGNFARVRIAGDSIWLIECVPDAGCRPSYYGTRRPGRLLLRRHFLEDMAYVPVIWRFDRH